MPSASSSSIGISCNYGGLGAGTILCVTQSPAPIISCSAGTCATSVGFQNRLILYAAGNYNWQVPSNVTRMKAVVIGAGGGSAGAAGGGGAYSEKIFTTVPGQAISATVGTAGSAGANGSSNAGDGGPSSITINGVTITATGGKGGNQSRDTDGAGGTSSGGDINTSGAPGDSSVATGFGYGGGAGGPFGNGTGGWFGGLSSVASGLQYQSGSWWDPQDIVGQTGTPAVGDGSSNITSAATPGGLGAPGGGCIWNNGVSYPNIPAGQGGFGAGGGDGANCGPGGSGGIGGGAGPTTTTGKGNVGGPGIAILWW